jgi:hypothetical protein
MSPQSQLFPSRKQTTNTSKDMGKRDHYTLLIGISSATMETSKMVPQKN